MRVPLFGGYSGQYQIDHGLEDAVIQGLRCQQESKIQRTDQRLNRKEAIYA